MRNRRRAGLVGLLTVGAILGLTIAPARGQAGGLGGYGAMAGNPGGGGMGAVAPFGGRFGAAVPATLGSGGGLGFRPRPAAAMSPTRTAFTIGPAGAMAGGSGLGSSRRPFMLRESGRGGMAGAGMRRGMAPATGMGVMPPSFASPFRQPPSLLPPGSSAPGMAM